MRISWSFPNSSVVDFETSGECPLKGQVIYLMDHRNGLTGKIKKYIVNEVYQSISLGEASIEVLLKKIAAKIAPEEEYLSILTKMHKYLRENGSEPCGLNDDRTAIVFSRQEAQVTLGEYDET